MMASSQYLLSEEVGIPKWKLALAVGGVTVAIGAGVYYAFYRSQPKKKSTASKKVDGKTTNGVSVKKPSTPLEEAIEAKNKGNALFRNGKHDEAITLYDVAIAKCPTGNKTDLSTFYQNRAAAYEQKKDYKAVIRDCSEALKLNPSYIKALNRRARVSDQLQDYDLALEDYTALCILENFSDQKVLVIVDKILKIKASKYAENLFKEPRVETPSVYLMRAHMAGFCNDPIYNSLSNEKEGGSEDDKSTMSDGYKKAWQLLKDEKYEDIIKCCTKELTDTQSSYRPHALLLRGTMAMLQRDNKTAQDDLSNLANMSDAPKEFRAAALVKLGAIKVSLNENEEAMVVYNRAQELDENNVDIYHQRGQMYLMMNQIDLAIDNFTKASEMAPTFAIGYIQRVHTDYRRSCESRDPTKTKEIIEKFRKAIKMFPKCQEAYILLAQILTQEEQFSEADKIYEELLSMAPDSPVGIVYRAMLKVQWKTELNEAIAMIKEAIKIDPHCELALENLATIRVQTGNLAEGIKLFNQALPLSKSLNEAIHFCTQRDAAEARLKVVERLGISLASCTDI